MNLLTNLTELDLKTDEVIFPNDSIDLESTAKSLLNLKRLHLENPKSEMIEPFFQNSTKLNGIKIEQSKGDRFINLISLNKKREIFFGAKKVTIFLDESAYLATKWRYKASDLKMIELQRAESWQYNFGD